MSLNPLALCSLSKQERWDHIRRVHTAPAEYSQYDIGKAIFLALGENVATDIEGLFRYASAAEWDADTFHWILTRLIAHGDIMAYKSFWIHAAMDVDDRRFQAEECNHIQRVDKAPADCSQGAICMAISFAIQRHLSQAARRLFKYAQPDVWHTDMLRHTMMTLITEGSVDLLDAFLVETRPDIDADDQFFYTLRRAGLLESLIDTNDREMLNDLVKANLIAPDEVPVLGVNLGKRNHPQMSAS